MLLDGVEARSARRPAARSSSTPAGTGSSVAYDDELRRIAGDVLGSLDTLERYNLVDDAWNEVVAGRLAAADFLSFVEGFGGERDLRRVASDRARLPASDGSSTTTPTRVPGPCARWWRRWSPSSAARSPARTTCGQAARPAVGAFAVLGDDAEMQARAGWYDQAEESPAASTPSSLPPATSIVAATGDEAMYERLLAGYRRGHQPAGAAAPPQRAQRVRRRGPDAAYVRAGHEP